MSDNIRFSNVLMQSAQDGNANGSALETLGFPVAVLQVTAAAFTGTVNFEATVNETDWVSLNGVNIATGTVVNTTIAAGIFRFGTAGLSKVRARTSGVTDGSVSVLGRVVNVGAGADLPDIEATLVAGDIEIGAVEIKNSTDDTRATVGANGLHVDVQPSNGVGSLTEAAPASDTASSGLNGRLQRIAQRITSLISLLPAALGAGGGLKVDGSGTALPVSAASLPLPTGAATEATQLLQATEATLATRAADATLTGGSAKAIARGAAKGATVAADVTVKAIDVDTNAISVDGSAVTQPVSDGGGVLSVDDGASSLTVDNPALSVVGSGVEAAALRVTVATDSTGVLSVDDNSASLTVDNPVLSVVGGGAQATAQRVALADESLAALETITVDFEGDTSDLDSDAGTDSHAVVAIGLPASGGHVVGGTATDPLRTDPTGTTTQPVSAASLPLPAGAATSALQTQPGVDIGDVTVNNGAAGAAVNVQDGGNSLTVDSAQLPGALVGGRLDVSVGAALPAGSSNIGDVDVASIAAGDNIVGRVKISDGTDVALVTAGGLLQVDASGAAVPVTDNAGSLTVDSAQLPGALVGGRLDINVGAALPAGSNNIGDVDTTGAGINIAASITEVASGTGDVQAIAATPNLRLVGLSARENAGTPAPASLILRHGTLVTDPALVLCNLAGDESIRDWFGPEGIGCPDGIFVDRVSGETHLVLWTKAVA